MMATCLSCGHDELIHDRFGQRACNYFDGYKRSYDEYEYADEYDSAIAADVEAVFCKCKHFEWAVTVKPIEQTKPKKPAKVGDSLPEASEKQASVTNARMRAVLAEVFPAAPAMPSKGLTTDTPGLYVTSDGMLICYRHAQEVFHLDEDFKAMRLDKFPASKPVVQFLVGPTPRNEYPRVWQLDQGCVMCSTLVSYGNECLNCRKRLHERWPSVYCSNRCALDDAYDT